MNNENVVMDSDEANVPASEQDSYDRSTTSDIVDNDTSRKDDIGEEPEDNSSWKETSDSCPYHLRRHPNLSWKARASQARVYLQYRRG